MIYFNVCQGRFLFGFLWFIFFMSISISHLTERIGFFFYQEHQAFGSFNLLTTTVISPSNDVIWLLLVEPLRSCIFYLLFSRRCCQCMIIKSVWWQVLGWIKSHWFPDIRPFIEYSYQRLKTYHDPTRRGKIANNQLWKSPLHCRTFLNLKAESLCEEKEIRTELFITHWNILHVKILSKRGILRLKTSLFLS